MLLRHTLLYLPAQALAPLAQFLAAVVWTHWMSPEVYGVLTFLVAAQDLVFVLCLSWWSAFCLRYLAGFSPTEHDAYRRSESAVLALAVLAGALASLGVLAYLRLLASGSLVLITVVFLVSRSLNVHFAERARAQERIFAYTIAQIAGPVAGFALAFAFVRLYGPSPAAALAGFAVPQALAAIWLRKRLGVRLALHKPDRHLVRRALAYGFPMVIGGALGWVSLNGIRIVVQEMGDLSAMGLLAVGWSLGQRLAGVTAMLVTAAAFPLAVRRLNTHSREDALRQFGAAGTLLMAVVVPAAVGLWQISPSLVDLMIAETFRATTLAILPASILTGAVRNLRLHYADQSFLLFERTALGISVNFVEAVAVIAFAAIGYSVDGLVGAVDGCLLATCMTALGTFVLAHRRFGLPLLLADWGRIATAASVMGLAVRIANAVPWADFPRLVLQVVVGLVLYPAMLCLLFPRRAKLLRDRLLAQFSSAKSGPTARPAR